MSDCTPTARTTVRSDADAIRYSNSAVFPIPASPFSTSDRLSPRQTAATKSSSSAHSLVRPRRPPVAGALTRSSLHSCVMTGADTTPLEHYAVVAVSVATRSNRVEDDVRRSPNSPRGDHHAPTVQRGLPALQWSAAMLLLPDSA